MELIPPNHMIAKSVILVAGMSSSTVTDLLIQNAGNAYQVDEVSAVPGFDLRIKFVNILRFSKIAFAAYYKGRTNHHVAMQMFNQITGKWEKYCTLESSSGMSYQYFDAQNFVQYIKAGEVLMRFLHPGRGIVPGSTYIDYVALVR